LGKIKNILIIGGNGFIGSHLTDLFLQMSLSVRILDKYPEKYRVPLPLVDYRLGEFSDLDFLDNALDNQDVVINLANTTVPANSNNDCSCDIQNNLIPSVKLLDLMIRKKCRKIIFLSSGGAVYGNPAVSPTPEYSVLQPISSYGIVKAAIEHYIGMYGKLYGMEYLIIRPSNLYGQRQGSVGIQGLINTILDSVSRKKEVTIWGNGNSVRDYLYINDLVEFFRIAIEKDTEGVFNVGSGKGYSVNDIIRIISETTGCTPEIINKSARSFDVERIVLDIKKAESQLDWHSSTPIEKGICDLWKYKNR
jgi:UDP-glucose 4-epimerase